VYVNIKLNLCNIGLTSTQNICNKNMSKQYKDMQDRPIKEQLLIMLKSGGAPKIRYIGYTSNRNNMKKCG